MAFDKGKVLKAAEKFLGQGKISAAIKEYRQLVDNDPDDLTALNMLGDLCVRASKRDEAISCFQRIAEHYSDQEFTLKAIAMYKKIDRLKPRDPYIANKLANLYATQGLVVDARAQYLVIADAYTRAGETRKALDIFHRIADLDPQNTDIRLKLAEGYLKENMQPEAAQAFVEAGRHFYERRTFDKSLEAYTKALGLTSNKSTALRGLVDAHIALGTADEAVEILERAVEEQPGNRELLLMLIDASLEADDAKGAERATAAIISEDPSGYTRLIPVARLYLKLGEADEATRLLTGIAEQMLAGREERELLEIVKGVLALNPDHVAALRLLVRVHWWQRDMEALRSALERLAEAAQSAGLVENERYALTQLVRLVPDEQKFAERLNELGGSQEEEAAEPLIPPDAVSEAGGQFETFSPIDVPAAAADTSSQFEWQMVGAPPPSDPSSSFAELNEVFDHSAVAFESPFETHSAQEITFGATPEQQPAASADGEERSKREAMMRQELESVDFYIAQGYRDIAADTLDMLERQFGMHPDIQSRRQALEASGAATDASPAEVFEFGLADDLLVERTVPASPVIAEVESSIPAADATSRISGSTSQSVNPPVSAPASGAIHSGLAEIFEEFRVAAEEEHPRAHEDYETHYNMGIAYKEMDLIDDAIHEFQTAANLVKPSDGTSRFLQCCNMLGHCFMQKQMPRAAIMWFQKALDSDNQSEEERKALRYELAMVLESMGEIDRALDLFTEVYGVDINYREVGQKLLQLAQKQKPRHKRKKS